MNAKDIKLGARTTEPKAKKEKKQLITQVSAEKMALFSLIWEGLSNFYG